VEGASRKSGTETEGAHIDLGLGKLQYNTLARLSSLVLRLGPIGNEDYGVDIGRPKAVRKSVLPLRF
jgi:hypothetical protein